MSRIFFREWLRAMGPQSDGRPEWKNTPPAMRETEKHLGLKRGCTCQGLPPAISSVLRMLLKPITHPHFKQALRETSRKKEARTEWIKRKIAKLILVDAV